MARQRLVLALIALLANLAALAAATGSADAATSDPPVNATFQYGSLGTSAIACFSTSDCIAGAQTPGPADGVFTAAKALASGTAYRWGRTTGEGPVAPSPTLVQGVPGTIVQMATSNAATYVLLSDGSVWAWGSNRYGALGNDTGKSSYDTAVKVSFPSGVTITQLANPMPSDSGIAIDSSGNVWGWGRNLDDAMCINGADLATPTEIPGLSGVTLATGQGSHSVFDDDGTVVSCGNNTYGQLGDGTTTSSATPVDVVGLPDVPVTSLESSWNGSGALLEDGNYYDWGFNKQGQMGVGNTQAAITTAEQVNLEGPAAQVFQGGCEPAAAGATVALLKNGTVWSWGAGSLGQLGNGGTTYSDVPVNVSFPGNAQIVEVVGGGAASFALSLKGTLWSWGSAEYGELGNGKVVGTVLVPTKVKGGPFTYVSSSAFNVSAY